MSSYSRLGSGYATSSAYSPRYSSTYSSPARAASSYDKYGSGSSSLGSYSSLGNSGLGVGSYGSLGLSGGSNYSSLGGSRPSDFLNKYRSSGDSFHSAEPWRSSRTSDYLSANRFDGYSDYKPVSSYDPLSKYKSSKDDDFLSKYRSKPTEDFLSKYRSTKDDDFIAKYKPKTSDEPLSKYKTTDDIYPKKSSGLDFLAKYKDNKKTDDSNAYKPRIKTSADAKPTTAQRKKAESTSPAASKKEKEKSRSVKSPENKTPKPWVPSDRPAPKMSEIPCGDDTATKSTSMLYNSAPQDPQKVPYCSKCNAAIRGPFILALNKCWCPSHFTCSKCGTELINMGFVELNNQIYCENDYEAFFAPKCAKCHKSIIGDTVNALNKTWHPACFLCVECSAPITHGAFHVEDGKPYCMKDWQRMFQTKCKACNFPVEAGDRWIEAMDSNWHAECFICQVCNVTLEGKPFFAREGKPYCKGHAGASR